LIGYSRGKVIKILGKYNNCTEILVSTEKGQFRAVNYDMLTGKVREGDEVLLNTTAVDLKLGSGGVHFVVSVNEGLPDFEKGGAGHIMKLRYTPLQFSVLSAEEQQSPYHEVFNDYDSIDNMPVIIGELHSMLLPAVFNIKRQKPGLKVTYIMTDGGALPIDFSKSVSYLKEKKLIEGTVTFGQAFGGSLETVNIYTALIAARHIQKADIAVVTMGPGITGTGTKFGFSGIEQGPIIDAVNTLGGRALFIPRISFADPRNRHYGISHHSITVLTRVAKTRTRVILSEMELEKQKYVTEQIRESGIDKQHDIIMIEDVKSVEENITSYGYELTTMGRSFSQDREFFLTAGAAGYAAAELVEK